jgi:glycolate oxidase FAD binding subunit
MLKTNSIEEQLVAITGAPHVRAGGDAISGVLPQFFVEPEDERQLAAVLAYANENSLSVIPRGGGTKLDWGNAPKSADLILSTARLNRIVEHAWADLTVTVEAGCTLQSLQSALAQHGQRLAFDGLWPERATIGGVLSTNESGALRLRFGALRDLIIGVTFALPEGTLASSGGKVVKNVAGYDLPKLATGAFGTLGIITRAVFRLHPLPRFAKTISFTAENLAAMQTHLLVVHDSKLAHTAVQFCCGSETPLRADILFEATEEGISAQELALQEIIGLTPVAQSSETVWKARQDLWTSSENSVIAKIGVLPADFANTVERIAGIARAESLQWQLVGQATGIAVLRFKGQPAQLAAGVNQARTAQEQAGGSLVVLLHPSEFDHLDAWGNPGDALPLMRAVKHQLDPKNTLNPGRFVGGI